MKIHFSIERFLKLIFCIFQDISDSSSPPLELEAEIFYPEREVLEFTEVCFIWFGG